uniref:Armadillo repeat-containing protein 8 n=1 Tax=Chlamydomonas euryale TaxID=1486919 RepID=A0A7R9V3G5_9CHLO|mmetsp:Transcript_17276/g.51916  ORF Transcript_17276/g.51916 Transcript_17276/m.51916 type:complete len:542 (+) Transcript_17276:139-1764(+)
MATLAEENAKHSVVYEDSTSEIKDDVVQLIGCFKTNTGPLNRQSAAFLLWHHALGQGRVADLVSNNAVNVCVSILESSETTPVDKSCAAGILSGICLAEENREAVVRGKAAGVTASAALHAQLVDGDGSLLYATRTLRMVAECSASRAVLLKQMEQKLQYLDLYLDFLYKRKDSVCVAHVCGLLAALLTGRPDIVDSAVEGGLVEALLHVMRKHKSPQTVCEAVSCLYKLVEDRSSWRRIINADGLRLLVDVLGPPPASVIDHETRQHRALLDPKYAADLRKEAIQAAEDAHETSKPSTPANGSHSAKLGRGKPVQGPSTPSKTKKPDVDPRTLLSINSCGLKWHHPNEDFALAIGSAAAGCLYEMATNEVYMHDMSRRLVASRLVVLLKAAMSSGDTVKKAKGKKKGLSLTPEQSEAAKRIVGCLKFLTMVNANRYRVAQIGAASLLIPLYEECMDTLLRRNAQTVLANIAMLAENGQVLLDSKLPEEFLVPVPMRLSKDEVNQLTIEFPTSTLRESFNQLAKERSEAALAQVEQLVKKL